jgi:uridine kinase
MMILSRKIFVLSLILVSFQVYAKDVFIVGISGGSASGKTTLAKKLVDLMKSDEFRTSPITSEQVGFLSQDNYFLPEKQPESEFVKGKINFDHPSAIDFALLREHLHLLKSGKEVNVPHYDYVTAKRTKETHPLGPIKLLVFEGIHAFHDQDVRLSLNFKVFVEYPADLRLARRIIRDQIERKQKIEDILYFYINFVRPMHEKFIEPTKEYADLIVSGDSEEAQNKIGQSILKSIAQDVQ